MRIAILTLPLHTNYGGILQSYALQKVLQRMGHEVQVIDNVCPLKIKGRDVLKNAYVRLVDIVKGRERKKAVNFYAYLRQKLSIRSSIARFIREYIDFTPEKYDMAEVLEDFPENDFDIFIVGSDQVWRTLYVSCIDNYFLSFLKHEKVKRIAYSASFGVDYDEYTSEQIKICGQYFTLFDAVSVREDSGLALIEDYQWKCKTKCLQTLDPTLLLTADDYIHLLQLNVKAQDMTLCAYILDVCIDIEHICDQLARTRKLKTNRINLVDEAKFSIKQTLTPSQWLEHIAASQFVVTDSFHGCVFSILFHKPFIVFVNPMRGNARMISLLRLLQLEDRLVSSYNDFGERKVSLLNDIDYQKVDLILKRNRFSSLKFLDDSINIK